VSTFAQITLFVGGGIAVLTGDFTIGMFTIFTSYFKMMLNASKFFFGLGASYQQALVSFDRMQEIFSHKTESCGETVITDVDCIRLQNVCFSYTHEVHDKPNGQVKNICTQFTKGKIYAIVGANGIGKSTLISLLAGMYINEYKGVITYNDIDIRNINMTKARRDLIGFAEQDPVLICDSIRYNLNLGNLGDITNVEQAIKPYADVLSMTDFLSKRTLDYEINDGSTNLSGGERQKLAMLKVLIKNSCVMIFDEPTSAFDATTTQNFILHLNKIKKNKIILIITHDANVREWCDEVLELAYLTVDCD